MAEPGLRECADPEAKQLAQTIIDTQRGEIAEMEALLAQVARAVPVPRWLF